VAFVSPRREATPFRWTQPEQWHLTLAFSRDVPDRVYDDLVERLTRAANVPAGEVQFVIVNDSEFNATALPGGFFVVNKRIGSYLTDDTCVLEQEPLNRLAAEGQIAAYVHSGFWQCMDTYREQQLLTSMWNSGKAPWGLWQQ
jgi:glucose-1-phosphate cytidylyltransferase